MKTAHPAPPIPEPQAPAQPLLGLFPQSVSWIPRTPAMILELIEHLAEEALEKLENHCL